jgi:hypothetical protein
VCWRTPGIPRRRGRSPGRLASCHYVVGSFASPSRRTVEQLSGFFTVTCDDYDALVEAAEVLVRAHPVVEIRPVKEF